MSVKPVYIDLDDEESAKYEYLRKRGGLTHKNIYLIGLEHATEKTKKEIAEELRQESRNAR